MDFTILGPLGASCDGTPVALGSRKQRVVLAILLLRANEFVSPEALIDELWGERPPPSAAHTLQAYVSRLRAALRAAGADDGIMLTRPGGYLLRVGHGELDLERFEGLVAEGRRALEAGEPARASELLHGALGVWQGPPLADLAFEPFARIDVERLEEQRLAALEDRIEADLARGRQIDLVAELRELVERHPLRERLRGSLLLALYRAGRQAEALAAYRDARQYLVGELGLEPSRALQALEQAILRQDASLDLAPDVAIAAPAGPPRRRRRLLAGGGVLALAVALSVGVGLRSGAGPAGARAVTAHGASAIAVTEPGRGEEVTAQPVAGRLTGLSLGAGALWASDATNDRVLRLDAHSSRIEDRIAVGRDPGGIAAGAGRVWVVNTGSGSVSEISPGAGSVVATVRVGNAPVAIALGGGAAWVVDAVDGTLTRIDVARARRLATIDLGQPLTDVVYGLGAVWVTSAASGLLFRIDPAHDRIVEAVSVGNGAGSLAIAAGAVWVADPPDDTVTRVDPASTAIRKLAVSHPGELSALGDELWVAHDGPSELVQLDTVTGALGRRIAVTGPVAALASDGQRLALATRAGAMAHRGGTLRVVAGDGLESADPGQAWSQQGWQVLSLVYDGLVTYARVAGPAGATIVPDLATSLPVVGNDGRAYTFRLRAGIRYSTGAPVQPADFRAAVERQFRAGTGLAALGVPIQGAAECSRRACDLSSGIVVDEHARTVTFRLVRPDPQLLLELALPFGAVVPAGSRAIGAGAPPPGTGPYRVTRFRPDRTLVLRRNPRFRGWSQLAQPAGFPQALSITSGLSSHAQSAAVSGGRADLMLDSPPVAALDRLARSRPLALHSYAQPTVEAMFLNTRLPPFDRPAVRRALSLAVDRARIVALEGGPRLARASCQILPPGFPGYRPYCPATAAPDPTGTWHAPDLARARRLIAASGTRGMRVRVSTDSTNAARLAFARYFVGLLTRLGYRAELRGYAGPQAYYAAIGAPGSRSQIGTFGWTADFQAASNFFHLFTCAAYRPHDPVNLNAAGLCDPALDRTIDAATRLQSTGTVAAAGTWQSVDRAVTDRAPWIPLANPLGVDYLAARVGNYARHPAFGVLLDQLWVR